jgi:hypothetical protein
MIFFGSDKERDEYEDWVRRGRPFPGKVTEGNTMPDKYKIGDTVLVRARVISHEYGLHVEYPNGVGQWSVHEQHVYGLEPRQWTVGDKVRDSDDDEGVIAAVNGGEAVVWYPDIESHLVWVDPNEFLTRVE